VGTVGISFGSPTGGTGFDVSSTVSQIVANLQNIETPWKSQLTTLQTQDTAISSLGSLLSTLSTDIGNFTNFGGVLSGKEGSSSDPTVLALSSASSEAVSGTHSIVVNKLAATSSGYLDSIANSADTLSGSISIQVGSAAAQTISITSGNNTLAGLAGAINSAGIGVTAGVISDSNGSRLSLVSNTSGAGGDLTVTSSVTDATTTTALQYNLAIAGVNASLIVDGINISSASNTVSTVIPGVTFQLLATSPITNGTPETVQVQVLDNNDAVVSSMDQFVSDYNAVISAVNLQETNTSSGTPEPLFGSPTLTLLQEQLLASINATNPPGSLTAIPHAGDTLTGSLSIATGSGAATVFNLSALPAANQNLAGLAAAINTAAIGVTASVVTNASGSSLSLASDIFGANSTLNVSSSVSDGGTILSYTTPSDINSLTTLGLSVNNDGSLSLDSAAMTSELNSDYSGVVGFFQDSNSWGSEFSATLSNLGTSSTTGALSLALSADSAIESALDLNISNENLVISTQQTSLTAELDSANEILQGLPANLNDVAELYSSITGYVAPTG
jgi:flagellar hook-associated protein 2